MNAAFPRSEAVARLESYAPTIVEHLGLLTWFPENQAATHWKAEIQAVKNALKRFHNSKMKKDNYTLRLIQDALEDMFSTAEKKDYVVIGVEAHGVRVSIPPDWRALKQAVHHFAQEILKKDPKIQ